MNLLGDFEHSEQPEGPQGWKTERSGPLVEVDPEHFEHRTSYHHGVKPAQMNKKYV